MEKIELLKRLEKQGLVNRMRPESNERKLYISLTEEGEALKHRVLRIPQTIRGCIDLPDNELIMLRTLLDKALASMEAQT